MLTPPSPWRPRAGAVKLTKDGSVLLHQMCVGGLAVAAAAQRP